MAIMMSSCRRSTGRLLVVLLTAGLAAGLLGAVPAGFAGTGTNKTGTNKTGTNKTGTNKTGTNKTGTNKTGTNKTGTNKTGTNKTGADTVSKAGIGDPYYPSDGNPGYNVKRYRIALRYRPQSFTIAGRTTVAAKAKTKLVSFNLDLDGLTVESVRVNRRRATWARAGAHELVVTPASPVSAGRSFRTVVRYRGKLHNLDDGGAPSGFIRGGGAPGAGYLEGEPHGCATWFPCNDHPTDKARFALNMTLPRPLELVSVGRQRPTISRTRDGVRLRTYRWRLGVPTATYLVGWYADDLTWRRSRTADGLPIVSAYGPHHAAAMRRQARLPEILRTLSRRWGPYPAPAAGGMFVDDNIPYELETFSRPVYSTRTNLITIVHENAHQWWGDHISLRRWKDICFNECLASYSEWLWREHTGTDLDRRYRAKIRARGDGLFAGKLYDMGAGHEFDSPVYVKGKFFVHALRNKVGERRFFRAMRALQRARGGGNLSMNAWRDELERRTDVDLTSFWNEWVLSTARPSNANLFPGDL
jgi:aminopeptidase N